MFRRRFGLKVELIICRIGARLCTVTSGAGEENLVAVLSITISSSFS